MPAYEDLNRTHPERDEVEGQCLEALYEGGKKFKRHLTTFLPQHEREKSETYEARKREVDYRNYVGPIIDFFTALLFSSRPVAVALEDGEPVTELNEYWEKFRDDADGHGGNVDALAKELLTRAMVRGRSWVRIHSPSGNGISPQNAKEFSELGLGDAWISLVNSCDVLDWDYDESGTLESVVIHSASARKAGPWGPRDQITETWERIDRDTVETYEITYPANRPPAAKDEVQQKGILPHGFSRVPVVPLTLPTGLHVASRLELPQLAHFRLLNAFHWSLRMSCFAQPVFKVEDSEAPPVMGAGVGIMIGIAENMEWQAPPSGHFSAHSGEVEAAKDEIFRIAHQMALGVENNAAAVGRSGESKAQDALHTKVVLLAFARVLKEVIEIVYDTITKLRGEDYTWSIGGLDDFASADIYGLLDALEKLDKAGGIHSDTFRAEMEKRLAEALLSDASQATKQTIKKEIEEGVKKASEEENELQTMVRDMKKTPPAQAENFQ